ncbi:MAG: hypothetical protein JJU16_04915 [Alkalibacterium sp.]|nr:hypothetical protein [Alkalibacterium sp.]
MQKKKVIVLGLFSLLSLSMFWGLFRTVIPVFPTHSLSMVVGVLAYLSLSFIILTSEWKNQVASIAAGASGMLLVVFHLAAEMNLIAAIRFPAMTNPFGYAALAAFLVALAMKGISMIDQWRRVSQYIHGVLTIGVGFVYWHVASIGVVAASWLFFIPFTAILIWTLFHFGVVILFQKKRFALHQAD